MSITQKIKYNSDNTYFAGFLQNIINEAEILASVEQKDGLITLRLDTSDEAKVNEFNKLAAKYIPHSIYLGDIESFEDDEKIITSDFKADDCEISPCAKCIELINDPSSEHYLDENLACNHYSNDAQETYYDETIFSPHYSKGCSLLVSDASKLSELFVVTEAEAKVLFSIEKPSIKVTIKDETLKNLVGDKFIYIRSPYNIKSMLAAINAKESGVKYLFFYPKHDFEAVLVKENMSIIKASRIVKDLENLNEDKILNRFLNIKKEAGFEKTAIASYLSTKAIEFIVSNEMGTKKVIRFGEFDLKTTLEGFKSNEKRARLMDNLRVKYPAVAESLENEDLDLFETIASILELDKKTFQEGRAFDAVCNKSYEFRGNAGLKIDTNFTENGFDYEAFIGAMISFKLAGVEMNHLAYSIFEALADLSITVMSQLKTKFKIQNFIMMGDLFANSVLYSRVISKFQLNNPYFSKAFALDG